MLLLWLRQVQQEAMNWPSKQVREFWQQRLRRAWESTLLDYKVHLIGKDEGWADETSLIADARKVWRDWSPRLHEVVGQGFTRDRYGNNWLPLGTVKDDLRLTVTNPEVWTKWVNSHYYYGNNFEGVDLTTDPRLAELREVISGSFPSDFKAPRDRHSYPTLLYALFEPHRELLEDFRANPESVETAAEKVHLARCLEKMDWIDGLDELELFEAALGERTFPVLGLPHESTLIRLSQEQADREQVKRRPRVKNGNNFGATGIMMGALLGAVGFAAWRGRAA
jgi:hypothetical protein